MPICARLIRLFGTQKLTLRKEEYRWLRDYQCPDSDIIGRHHYEVFPEIPEKWRQVHRRALAGEVLSAEEDHFVRNGAVMFTRWQCRPWYHSSGSIGGIVLYTEVITQTQANAE